LRANTIALRFWASSSVRISGAATAASRRSRTVVNATVVARSPIERLVAFKKERGWRNLRLYQDLNGAYSKDYFGVAPDGSDIPAYNVFTRQGGTIRHFWGGEMTEGDPGQDPRGAPDLSPLWNILDVTPEGRGTDWYPKLDYPA